MNAQNVKQKKIFSIIMIIQLNNAKPVNKEIVLIVNSVNSTFFYNCKKNY